MRTLSALKVLVAKNFGVVIHFEIIARLRSRHRTGISQRGAIESHVMGRLQHSLLGVGHSFFRALRPRRIVGPSVRGRRRRESIQHRATRVLRRPGQRAVRRRLGKN